MEDVAAEELRRREHVARDPVHGPQVDEGIGPREASGRRSRAEGRVGEGPRGRRRRRKTAVSAPRERQEPRLGDSGGCAPEASHGVTARL